MYDGGGVYFADSGDLTHSVQSLMELYKSDEAAHVRYAG